MTRIHGQIESLKRIRETLNQEGITRFNSIGEIKKFLKHYDNEKEELIFKIERQFDLELEVLQTKCHYLQKGYEERKSSTTTKLNNTISRLKIKSESLSHPTKNALLELLNWYLQQILLAYKFILEKNFATIVWFRTFQSKKILDAALKKVNSHITNRQEIISERSAPRFKELEHMKTICTNLYPIIAGAIGENLVAKELEKLSDDCVLFNDYSIKFDKPIFYKKEKHLIHSIQIDHLLVTQAGIFIIETKNWSKTSLERYDLRSPIKQIQRVSYALFVLLNPKERRANQLLKKHHWGNKKLPIRNIVAMIRHKPKEKFNHVAVKKLNELNNYIAYFEPIFDSTEVRNITDHLLKLKS